MDNLSKIIQGLKVNDINQEMGIAKNEPTPLDDNRMAQVMHSRNRQAVYPPYFITRNRKSKDEAKVSQEQANTDTNPTE